MTIDTQAFPLKSLSEPIDNASIVLHLSLFVKKIRQTNIYLFYLFVFLKILSPGRSSASRLSPLLSRSLSNNPSFDSLSSSATDVKREILKNPSFRTTLEEDSETKLDASGAPQQVNI
jgi:hypothetical protein